MRLLPVLLLLPMLACGDKDSTDTTVPSEADADSDTDADADSDADSDTDADTDTRYHPEGYESPSQHSLDAKLHVETCTDCHGGDLTGEGEAVSCDSCHADGWRTDCTFCHGGVEDTTGAPPESIDDSKTDDAFGAHSRHVQQNTHAPFECDTCHVKPDDVLTPGHFLDDTPAVAELDFSAGLSPSGSWNAKNTCSNLYCHGDGQSDGWVSVDQAPLDCSSCHPDLGASTEWVSMSGEHRVHLRHSLTCGDCHHDTTTDSTTISGPELHVNGVADFVPAVSTISRDDKDGTCTGSCHNENHINRTWVH